MRGLDLFHLQPLYQSLANRPELLSQLERDVGLRPVQGQQLGRLSSAQLIQLFELLHAQGEPHAGAKLAAQVDPGVAHGLVYFLRSHASLGQALQALNDLIPWLLPDGRWQMDSSASTLQISMTPSYEAQRLGRLLRYESGLVWLHGLIARCLDRAPPVERAACMTADVGRGAELEALLGCPVEFGAPNFALHLPLSCLDWPLPGHSPGLVQALGVALQRQLPRQAAPTDKSEQLLRWLRRQTDLSGISLEDAARYFECSPSTLRRWLSQESVKFADLLQMQRSWRAFMGVLDRRKLLPEVAEGLGYADRAGLERAFHATFGLRPAQLRQWLSDVQGQQGLGLAEALTQMAAQARRESRPAALVRSLSQAADTLPLQIRDAAAP